MEQNIGNNFDHTATLRFFARWWKVLLWVFVVALVASTVAAFVIKPRYKSTAVIFPTNSNRLSKAIMDYHYSLDFMDYGIERDCEYAIQILSSASMERDVCECFNLTEHYGISPNDPHKLFKTNKIYRSNITVKRTEFLGVEVSVLDVDPQWAADIANYMAANYDTLCHRIHHDRAVNAADVMQKVCADMQARLDSTASLPTSQWKDRLIAAECDQLADLQTRASQTAIDKDEEVSYKYMVDQAVPADKKAYPKRLLIMALGSIGAVVMCIFGLLLFAKKEE
ncbi:MAG: hypothetical protein IJ789_00980 [Bacteroidales bacterium]|nr:hypothetical protein [Bacteroidales bacterium]